MDMTHPYSKGIEDGSSRISRLPDRGQSATNAVASQKLPDGNCLLIQGWTAARAGQIHEFNRVMSIRENGIVYSASRMRQTDTEALVRVMIESVEREHSFFQNFWSPATHIGEAIDSVLSACVRIGINQPIAIEADYVAFNSLPENAVRVNKLRVWHAPERHYFPNEKAFIPPVGIIESSQKGEYDYELIREGFSLNTTEDDIYEVEAAIERDKLFDTFVELMKVLPSIRLFWIKLAADWEEQNQEEFWTNENLNTAELIVSFLKTNFNDTVANGYVALTVYSDSGETNLNIDTHKTIKVLTKSTLIQREMADALKRMGFDELHEFHSLEYCFYHWHYRLTRTKSRSKLIAALKKWGFKPPPR